MSEINKDQTSKLEVTKQNQFSEKQSSPLKKLRIDQKQSLDKQDNGISQVNEAKGKLDNLIQDLNSKLVNHFKSKEQALLNQYKLQLIEQQKQLNDLKNNTNEQQIKAKMLQRKSQLEKERNHLIQTNMFFSQKCQQYKQTYSQLVQQAQDLQRQIKFLDQQIDSANFKRVSLIQEAQKQQKYQKSEKSELPLFSDKKQKSNEYTERKLEDDNSIKMKQSSSVRKIAKSLHMTNLTKNTATKSGSQIKNQKNFNQQIFSKGILQKLFQESVQEVKNRRKSKRTMPNLKGEEFTEYQKRAIMEIFLSNEDVKKKIYEIIFQNNDKTGKGAKADPLIKISFEQIGM